MYCHLNREKHVINQWIRMDLEVLFYLLFGLTNVTSSYIIRTQTAWCSSWFTGFWKAICRPWPKLIPIVASVERFRS